ncbi:MAG TPA: flagellar hook-basal body complex protein [Bryobacteraceae bacterium]|nr:flagellar hook-basal body complex protein [Bryobacteraceae bacterium]
MPDFSVPLSGLDASSAALATTANNLANLNTVGYKDQQIQFADLFYQNLGSDGAGDPIQRGAGVQVSSQPTDFTQGDVTSTGIDTDVSINGNGLFVVEHNGVETYTRAGNFEVGTDNLLETSDGQHVLGYAAVDGVVSTSAGLSSLALGAGIASPAVVTTNVSLTSNLDATAPPGTQYSTQATIYDSLGAAHQVTFTYTNADVAAAAAVPVQTATGTLTSSGTTPSDGDQVTVGGTTYTFKTALDASTSANEVLIGASATTALANLVNAINGNTADANGSGAAGYGTLTTANASAAAADTTPGSLITLTASATGTAGNGVPLTGGSTLTASGTGDLTGGVNAAAAAPPVVNTWTYAVTLPGADISGASAPVSLASGTLVFNGDGTLQSVTPTAGAASATNPAITIPPASGGSVFADGANPLTFTWNLFDTNGDGLVTQTASASSTTSIQQNGAASGTLQNFSIGSDGTITGSFSNGTTAVVGQIALASFADEQGLSRNGDNTYSPTLASGQPSVGAPTSGGLGSITDGALEQSNVDIATEFANLIVAQRSYEANARVVTTFDQIAQDTIALKQ